MRVNAAHAGWQGRYQNCVEAVGLTGAIRVSPLHCHTVADIETYLRVTQELAQTFAK